MPECSEIENIILILKPQFFVLQESVRQMLESMNYRIYQSVIRELKPQQINNLISYLQIIKLPEATEQILKK